MKVSEIMSGEVFTIDEREPVIAAARLLKRLNLGALPVTGRGGALTGMITDRDIAVRCVASGADARELRVGDIIRGQVRRLPVVEGGRLVGMLSLADMAAKCGMEAAAALADISGCVRRAKTEE